MALDIFYYMAWRSGVYGKITFNDIQGKTISEV